MAIGTFWRKWKGKMGKKEQKKKVECFRGSGREDGERRKKKKKEEKGTCVEEKKRGKKKKKKKKKIRTEERE